LGGVIIREVVILLETTRADIRLTDRGAAFGHGSLANPTTQNRVVEIGRSTAFFGVVDRLRLVKPGKAPVPCGNFVSNNRDKKPVRISSQLSTNVFHGIVPGPQQATSIPKIDHGLLALAEYVRTTSLFTL
jgi:hypothetical protein